MHRIYRLLIIASLLTSINSSSSIFIVELDPYLISRKKRDTSDDPFSILQSRISSLARVVSGVTLYNGLVDGSIPVDEAISELMNIGSFSLDELMKFEEKKVIGFAEKLKAASTKMADNSIELETAIMDYLKMKEMWNEVGDLDKLPDNSKFEELKSMNSLDLKDIEDFKLTDALNKLDTTSIADIPIIKSAVAKIAEVSKKAVELMDEKHVLSTLADMTSFHKYVNLISFVENSRPYKKLDSSYAASMKADVNELQGIDNNGTSVIPIIKRITLSQSGTQDFDRKHTSGFVNGYADLKHLPKDFDDSFLSKKFRWLELDDGLTTISNLENGMKTLSEKWTELRKDKIRKAVQKAEFFGEKLKGISGVSNLVENLISKLEKYPYPEPRYLPGYSSEISEMSQHLFELFRKGEAIREISTRLEQNKDVITHMDTSRVKSIQLFMTLLQAIQPAVEVLQKGVKVNKLAELLVKQPKSYTEIKTDVFSTSCQAFLNAIKNHQGDDLEKVGTAAELTILIRELKTDTDFSTHIGIASTIVFGSSGSIESIRTTMGDIKKSSADNTQTFSQLKDLQKFSKPLGDTSAVIDKILKVLEKEKQLTNFVNNGDIVMQLTKSDDITNNIKNVAKKLWDGYYDVSIKSKILLDEVKRKEVGVKEPRDDKLESYGPIIGSLDGLGDVILNVDRRIMAIGKLLPSITDRDIKSKLNNLKQSLTELDSLDLTFARQSSSLKGISQVLAGINDVFLGTKPTNTVDPKTGENVCGVQFSPEDGCEPSMTEEECYASPEDNDTSTKGKSENDVVYWVGVGLLCTIFGGGIITFVVWVVTINIRAYRRQKRYKEEHKEEIAKARRMSDYIAGRVRSPGRRSYPVSKPPLSEDQ